RIGNDLKVHLNKIMQNSYYIKKHIKNHFNLYEINNNYNKDLKIKDVIAIDGSSNIGGQLSGKFMCLYSVVQIHLFIDHLNNIIPSEYYWGDMKIIDALDESEIKKKLEVIMLEKETEAYKNSMELFDDINRTRKIIFIDGPIIDPPAYNDKKYVKFRCDIIKRLLAKNILLIGCVKRIYGNAFCDYIKNIILDDKLKEKISLYLNDSYLISSLIADHRKQNNIHGGIITDFYENNTIMNEVLKQYYKYGIQIKSLFFQNSTRHNLIRVDIPFIRMDNINMSEIFEILKTNLVEWSYPGIDIPYPVYLAHEFSKIRNGCAQKIYDDIISRNLSNKPVGQLLINMLK
ncbi:MAG: DNA double-strand break repair nuclease NurA, partial [Promethearchaeota archaeon]